MTTSFVFENWRITLLPLVAAVTGYYLNVESAEPFVLAGARLRSYNMLGASEEDSSQ